MKLRGKEVRIDLGEVRINTIKYHIILYEPIKESIQNMADVQLPLTISSLINLKDLQDIPSHSSARNEFGNSSSYENSTIIECWDHKLIQKFY